MLSSSFSVVLRAWLLALLLCSATVARAAPAARGAMTAAVAGSAPVAGFAVNAAATPAAAQTLHLTLALAGVDLSEVNVLLRAQQDPGAPEYRRWLTPQDFGRRFGASEADIQAVTDWAGAQGLRVTQIWDNHAFVSVDATVAQAQAAFGVTLRGYNRSAAQAAETGSLTFYAPTAAPRLDAAVAARLSAVFGLSDFQIGVPQSHRGLGGRRAGLLRPLRSYELPALGDGDTASAAPLSSLLQPLDSFSGPLTPAQLSKIYNVDGLHTNGWSGQGQNIGIYSPTLWYPTDLDAFHTRYGFGYSYSSWLIDGGPTAYSGPDEAALDIETIDGQASASHIILYEPAASNTTEELNALNFVAQKNEVSVLSMSWAVEEIVGGQSFANSFNTVAAQLAAQGIAIYASSGDNGSYGSEGNSPVTVTTEGASPYVTGVGGTSLPSSNGGFWNGEVAWSLAYNPNGTRANKNEGSGGGLSTFNARPSWQAGPGVLSASSNGMRQVPDVAALAGSPYFSIYAQGQWRSEAGTSGSAPLWAAAALLMNQGSGSRLGNLNARFYGLGAQPGSPFHDITSGQNGLYGCTPGWDFVTGLGSADFTQLYASLARWTALAVGVGSDNWRRALWINPNGTAALWLLNPQGQFVSQQQFGPYPGWTCQGIATGGDNYTRVLWGATDGTIALWLVDPNCRYVSQQAYGPYPGWGISSLSAGGDSYTRVLWTASDGTAAAWLLDPNCRYVSQQAYGPFAGWTPRSLKFGPDNIGHMLWTHSGGAAAFWRVNPNNQYIDQQGFGPYAGFTATKLVGGPNGIAHAVWAGSDGSIAFWNLNNAHQYLGQQAFGPFGGWSLQALTVGPDGNSHLIWDSAAGAAAFWHINAQAQYLDQQQFGPF